MVVLEKLKGSTLMETLVATVLIVVVFMMSSMILNNLFSNALTSRTNDIEAHLNELHYLYLNDNLVIPYSSSFENWDITVEAIKDDNENHIALEAINKETKKKFNISFYAKD